MFFILFIVGSMVIPVMIDAKKNPGNNIFKRALNEFKKYKKGQ